MCRKRRLKTAEPSAPIDFLFGDHHVHRDVVGVGRDVLRKELREAETDLYRIGLREEPVVVTGAVADPSKVLSRGNTRNNNQIKRRQAGFRDRFGWAPAVALAAFAAIAILIAIPDNSPKDTFDDPAMAYAQVEAVFKDISGRIAYGMDKVSQAEAIASKPSGIINKTNRK